MPKMQIDTEQMLAASNHLKGGSDSLVSQISAFRAQVNNLLSSGWVAPSGTAFGTAYSEWDQAATRMTTALQEISTIINKAGTTFSSADSASTVRNS